MVLPFTKKKKKMVDAQYILRPSSFRAMAPEFLKVFGLMLVLYFALLLNLYLLRTKLAIIWHIIIFIIFIGLSYLEAHLKNKKHPTYSFYTDKVSDGTNEILYNQANIEIEKNFLDKILRTETISLSANFKMKNIKANQQIYNYIQNLINYARGNTNGN